jgi:hypothetical protein
MRRSNWNSGVPRLTWTLGATSTAVTRVGSDKRGVSWTVCWTIFAAVAIGVMKRRPIMKMRIKWNPTTAETTPHAMLNFSHLNLKKTTHTAKA